MGIDPTLMHDFERDLGQAENTLGRNEPQIRRMLQNLDLDTSRLNAMRELGNWIGAKRPELRRRNETIQAVTTEWGTDATGGLRPFDEALYSGASGDPDVYAAALKLREVDRNGKVDEKTIANLEKRSGDEGFATSLMYALGPERFRHLMAALVYQKDAGKKRLQAALGKALGAASSRLNASWQKEMLSNLRVPVDQHGLSALLPHGTFERDFLVAIAKTLDGLDRKSWNDAASASIPQDPMVGVMEALAKHPKAAQDFFSGDPSIMKRYVTERPMYDGGNAFGKALEAATMTYRDRDGTAQKPSPGFISAKIASDFIRWEAQRVLTGTEGPSFATTGSTARILAAYINDVNRVAKGTSDDDSAVFEVERTHMPQEDRVWGAQFQKEDLRLVMRDAFKHDPKALAAVAAAQTAWGKKLLDHGAARTAETGDPRHLLINATEAGAGFGLITEASGLAKIKQGQELDAAQERNMKVFMAVVNTGLGIPQAAAAAITAATLGSWTSMIEDAAKTNKNTEKAKYDANVAENKAQFLLDQIAADAMLRHGLFGKSDPPDKTHPWASLPGREKGENPRDSRFNFLKDDGNSLMTRKEMAPHDGNSHPRLQAYETWLEDALAGKRWEKIDEALTSGYNKGHSRHN
ncbi:hypothetical protein E1267_12710 [Nonomuraea longispora]|uniref:DUF6571 domain-containing protein n=1 Tax=Nonomuraea longispora TaxID=1848320 RepID=A0A4R4NFD0_9ACTN|nr:DUF6571 family protein [Nonomuraea longispora]TDC07679.1 hypothetical protein E1267_12710 [Nonomuraea longispora]